MVFVPQGTIIILEDYLVDNKDEVIENRIPMIELGTKDESDIGSWKLEEIDLDFGRRVNKLFSKALTEYLYPPPPGMPYLRVVHLFWYFCKRGNHVYSGNGKWAVPFDNPINDPSLYKKLEEKL